MSFGGVFKDELIDVERERRAEEIEARRRHQKACLLPVEPSLDEIEHAQRVANTEAFNAAVKSYLWSAYAWLTRPFR